jgi:hypothetical protein
VGVKAPHVELTVQVADQSTPPLDGSPVTVALKVAATPAVTEGGGVIATEIAGTIVTTALPVSPGSLMHWVEFGAWLQKIEVAVTVTGLVEGTALGAVKLVVNGEEALLVGLQAPGLQFQFTPALAPELLKSFATVAARVIVPFTCTAACDEPDGPATLTLIGGGGPTVRAAFPLLVGSAFDVAVTAIGRVVVPAGSDPGAK